MKTATKVLLGAAGAGVALVTAIGVASAKSSSTTTPVAAPPITWQLLQGHRYTVNIQPKPDVAIDLAGASTHPLLLPTGIALVVGSFTYNPPGTPSGTTSTTTGSIVYQIDATGPTHNEPQTTFVPEAGISPDSWIVNVYDMGLSSNYATAGAGAPSPSPATPPGATSPGGPTSGPFTNYGTPYTPPATPATPPATPLTTPTTGPAPSPSSGQSPTGAAGNWIPATNGIPAFAAVRFTMTPAQLSAFTAQAGGTGNPPDLSVPANARKSFEQVMLLQHVQGVLQSRVFFVWAPGDALPTDWPPDDPNLTDGYHVEMVYGVDYALAATSIPNPPALGTATLSQLGLSVVGFWGEAGAAGQTISAGPITWRKTGTVNPGDHVRVSMSAADVAQLVNSIINNTAGIASLTSNVQCLAFLLFCNQPTGFIALFGVPCLGAWCPGDAIPPDWPSDDAQASSEYHLELRAGATVAGAPYQMPSGQYWVARGAGA